MDSRLIALALLLDELGVDGDIRTIDDRKRIQKAVYLGQRAGVDLGYRFSWYLKGPYSPKLADDYYSLAEAVTAGDKEHEGRTLVPSLKQRLEQIRPLMDCAEESLNQEDWLELLASYDYLRRVLHQSAEQAAETMQRKKPTLAPHWKAAELKLREACLLP